MQTSKSQLQYDVHPCKKGSFVALSSLSALMAYPVAPTVFGLNMFGGGCNSYVGSGLYIKPVLGNPNQPNMK